MFKDTKHPEVFDFFREISDIPRGSGNEKGIAEHLVSFAEKRGLYCVKDDANNVFIRKGATSAELSSKAPVVLQGHTDMVCEADAEVVHDFLRDPIEFIRNGDLLTASGTTLGADNGVAVAIMMALLDSDTIPHPELECLFTSSEETGMDGMTAFDTTLMKARRMINLDSAVEGVATVSCAGGVRSDFTYAPVSVNADEGLTFYEIKLSGYYGGHSGEDINLGRANAIESVARMLRFIRESSPVYLVSWHGGEKDNAIPRECKAVFAVSESVQLEEILQKVRAMIKRELIVDDSAFELDCWCCDKSEKVITSISSDKIIDFVSSLHSGPVMMCRGIDDLVETSYNLSVIRVTADSLKITVTSRSSVEESLDDMETRMHSIGRLAGFDVNCHSRYPGWKFAEVSPMRDTYLQVYRDLFGTEGKAVGIHAGLECGLLMKKVPDMDIISIGPDIKDLHSPSESLGISSLDRLYDIVCEILKRI